MLSLKELMPVLKGDFTKDIIRVGPHIHIRPKKEHQYTFIWMHGLEDVPDSFLAGFNNPELSPFPDTTKIILLCAPVRPLTKNGGEKMTSWYDIKVSNYKQLWGQKKDDELWGVDQALESRDEIWKIIKDEPIPKNKIFIGGFSQGCAMSLLAGLGYPYQLGGIMGNSGMMFPFVEIKNKSPILIIHGEDDEVMPLKYVQTSMERLTKYEGYYQFALLKGVEHAMMLDNFKIMKEFFNKFK